MMSTVSFPSRFLFPDTLTGMPKDSPILLGFSGGADSVSLLHMLCAYRDRFGAPIYAAHIHHGIRGKEADRDEEFCRYVTDRLGVELFVLHADVPRIAKESGESMETAARRIRYAFFDSLMREHKIPILATAHNANDNLETMIFNMVRGSGLSGMCGIPVSRLCESGTLIRPILNMTRDEILAYTRKHSLDYVTDSTNTDTDYTRNKIRAELIPALCSLNGSAVEHAARLAESLRSDELCLQSMTGMFLEGLCSDGSVELEKLNGSPDAIVNRALMALYAEFANGASLTYAHITAIRALAKAAVPHSSVSLPHGIEAVVEQNRLVLRARSVPTKIEPYRLELHEGIHTISQTNTEIVISSSQNAKNIYKNSILFSFDSATINGMPFVRCREAGDTILLGGMHKSVKKLMCDKKIPLPMRDRIPILCDADGILAIPMLGQRDNTRPSSQSTATHFIFRFF